MKKKTYKQMQNRLYREIKRRIMAENFPMNPKMISVCERKIDTFRISERLNRNAWPFSTESIKRNTARKLIDKLYEEGYFEFYASESPSEPILDCVEIECRISVVKPKGEGLYNVLSDSNIF